MDAKRGRKGKGCEENHRPVQSKTDGNPIGGKRGRWSKGGHLKGKKKNVQLVIEGKGRP